MEEEACAACIKAINAYHLDHLRPLVVCSRTDAYERATKQEPLRLHTAVVVQPLSREQVTAYLAKLGKPVAALRTALRRNPTLQAVTTTPLLLQVLMLTYHSTSVRELSVKEEQLRKQIWTDYVDRMINRKGESRPYPLHRSVTWLSLLARHMRGQHQTIFELAHLQPDWLPKRDSTIYHCSVGPVIGLLAGLVFGLFFGPLVGAIHGVTCGLVGGLACGLVGGLVCGRKTKIEPTEVLTWSWKGLKSGLLVGLRVGLLIGLLIAVFSVLVSGRHDEWRVMLLGTLLFILLCGLVFGLPACLIGGLFGGFSGNQLTERSRLSPNEGVHRSLGNGLLRLPLGLLGGLVFGLIFGLISGLRAGLLAGLFFGLLIGLLCALVGGLGAVVQHFILRVFLWQTRTFPWKTQKFLDDATARTLLHRVGPGYSFIHRLLLEYFADLNAERPSGADGSSFHNLLSPPEAGVSDAASPSSGAPDENNGCGGEPSSSSSPGRRTSYQSNQKR